MDRAFASAFSLLFFFSRVFELFECYSYCSCTVQWTVTANFDFSNLFQPITAHRVLFTNPQISLFSNFFIKNGFHGTIHIFKNYFITVFFSFQFQFSAVSKRTLSIGLLWYLLLFNKVVFIHLDAGQCTPKRGLDVWGNKKNKKDRT